MRSMNSSSTSRTDPRPPERPRRARRPPIVPLLLLLITLAAAFLLLWRLGSPLLWQDEAETANVARNLLRLGVPTPWDGEHLVTQQNGRDAVRVGGRLLWAWHPWPQHYLAAAGLALFEERLGPTAAARLPFALIGLLTVPLVYAWRRSVAVRHGEGTWQAEALAATAIYGLSIAFVLYSRQCRYYPLLFLGGLLALWAYERIGARDRRESAPEAGPGPGLRDRAATAGLGQAFGLAGALTVVFYANPLSGLALGAGFGAHALLHHRAKPKRLSRTIAAGCLFALLVAPWLALVLVSDVRTPNLGVARRALLFVSQLWRAQCTLVPLVFWPVLAWLWWRGRQGGELRTPGSAIPAAASRRAAEIGLLAVLAGVMFVLVDFGAPLGPPGTCCRSGRFVPRCWPACGASSTGARCSRESPSWSSWPAPTCSPRCRPCRSPSRGPPRPERSPQSRAPTTGRLRPSTSSPVRAGPAPRSPRSSPPGSAPAPPHPAPSAPSSPSPAAWNGRPGRSSPPTAGRASTSTSACRRSAPASARRPGPPRPAPARPGSDRPGRPPPRLAEPAPASRRKRLRPSRPGGAGRRLREPAGPDRRPVRAVVPAGAHRPGSALAASRGRRLHHC